MIVFSRPSSAWARRIGFLFLLVGGASGVGAGTLGYETRTVTQLESQLGTDFVGAVAGAKDLKAELGDRRGRYAPLAERSEARATEWQGLSKSSLADAAKNDQRAREAEAASKDPGLPEASRQENAQLAKRWRKAADGSREESQDYADRARRQQEQAQSQRAELAEIDALIARLDKVVSTPEPKAPEPEEQKAEQQPSSPDAPETASPGKDTAPSKKPEKKPKRPFRLMDVIAMWRDPEQSERAFAIVQASPGSASKKLEMHTQERVWKGEFNHQPSGDSAEPVIVVRYTPKPEEMNPEIPEWARKSIAGELEWRMELDQDAEWFDPRLAVKWFPGKVRWREDESGQDGKVWLDGEGEPIEFKLAPEIALEIEHQSSPTLLVGIAGGLDPRTQPIDMLVKSQQIVLSVLLPPKEGKEAAGTVSVQVKSLGGGGASRTIRLDLAQTFANDAALYKTPKPVTVGNYASLNANDAEMLEFRFGKAFERIPAYRTYIHRDIARQELYAEVLRAQFEVKRDKASSRADKERYHQKLRMLENYQRMVRGERSRLTIYHRYALGDLYLGVGTHKNVPATGIVNANLEGLLYGYKYGEVNRKGRGECSRLPENRIDPAAAAVLLQFNEVMAFFGLAKSKEKLIEAPGIASEGILPEQFDQLSKQLGKDGKRAFEGQIVWTEKGEMVCVYNTLLRTSEKLASDIFKGYIKKSTMMYYDAVVYETILTVPLLVALTGKNHLGVETSVVAELENALEEAASDQLLTAVLGRILRFRASTLKRIGGHGGAGSRLRSRTGKAQKSTRSVTAQPGRSARKSKGPPEIPDKPKSLKPAQAEQLTTRVQDSAEKAFGSVGRPASAVNRESLGGGLPELRRRMVKQLKRKRKSAADARGYLRRNISPNAELMHHRGGDVQEIGSCVAMCTFRKAERRLKRFDAKGRPVRLSEQHIHKEITEILAADLQAGRLSRDEYVMILHQGYYPPKAVRKWMEQNGAQVLDLNLSRTPGVGQVRLPSAGGGAPVMTVANLDAARRSGYNVYVGMKFKGGPGVVGEGYHYQEFFKSIKDPDGTITHVVIYDSNIDSLFKMPAGEYIELVNAAQHANTATVMLVDWP